MAKKNKKNKGGGGLVYSTNPDFTPYDEEENEIETPPPSEQKLYVSLDKKQRGGKKVTLVEGFEGSEEDLSDLGRTLKKHCGVGGNTKDGEILVQGDLRDKVVEYLQKKGYIVKRKGG